MPTVRKILASRALYANLNVSFSIHGPQYQRQGIFQHLGPSTPLQGIASRDLYANFKEYFSIQGPLRNFKVYFRIQGPLRQIQGIF